MASAAASGSLTIRTGSRWPSRRWSSYGAAHARSATDALIEDDRQEEGEWVIEQETVGGRVRREERFASGGRLGLGGVREIEKSRDDGCLVQVRWWRQKHRCAWGGFCRWAR